MQVRSLNGAGARLAWLTRRAAREPLAQFMAAALALFVLNALVNGGKAAPAGQDVVISEGRVAHLAESYRQASGRLPSRRELEALVEDYIEEEVAYREAVALGLDVDDTIVRRRMRQKLAFLAEDPGASREPSDAELAAHLAAHAETYRAPLRIAFEQALASGDRRAARAPADAGAMAAALRAGASAADVGDGSLLPRASPLVSQEVVARQFGEDFAAALFAHDGEEWFGPVVSPFGAHAVRIVAREEGRAPLLAEVRDKVRSDLIGARRAQAHAAYWDRLRGRYSVKVDWPAPYASAREGEPSE